MRFSDLIGHRRLARWLARAAAEGRAAGAYLFYGPDGAGKASVASAFVAAVACSRRSEEGEACGTCPDCLAVQEGRHPDVAWVVPGGEGETVSIEQVRRLRSWLALSSGAPWGRAAVIEQADRMSLQAANALLKVLEEPPGPAVMVLLAREPAAVPETIQSRCLRFHVGPVPLTELAEALRARTGVSPEEAAARAALAGGLPGRALAGSGQQAARREQAMAWIERAVDGSPQELLRLSRSLESADPASVDELMQAMIWLWRDVVTWRWTKRPELLADRVLRERVAAVGDRVGPGRAAQALESLLTARRMMAEYANRRLVLHWAWMALRRARVGPPAAPVGAGSSA